ncbi:hypothetical protein TNCV_2614751 [Trichonephila clavipes]|nr:hypothetical protein TNCV_2614751 [Trichonephila clavipes]
MNDCPRLEEKKNDNSPVVLSTGTHRLLSRTAVHVSTGEKKTMSGASLSWGSAHGARGYIQRSDSRRGSSRDTTRPNAPETIMS